MIDVLQSYCYYLIFHLSSFIFDLIKELVISLNFIGSELYACMVHNKIKQCSENVLPAKKTSVDFSGLLLFQ